VRTERKRAAAGKLLEAPEVSFAKTTRGVPRRFLSSPTHHPIYIYTPTAHIFLSTKNLSPTPHAIHSKPPCLCGEREEEMDAFYSSSSSSAYGAAPTAGWGHDSLKNLRQISPAVQNHLKLVRALYLLSLPPPLGVVGRCRSIRWALRRGGILECGNGSIRFIYSRLLTGGVRGGSFFVGVDLSARWFS
jgi:hypothetical protein